LSNIITLFFANLELLENFIWGYFCVPFVLFLGLYLSVKSKFIQLRKLPTVVKTFFSFLRTSPKNKEGVHPLKAFFACVGGCIGVGNIVGICTAIQMGGPGALFWIWVTAIAGMIIKYSEVYLGFLYREPDGKGGYNGGPMYFIKKLMKKTWAPNLVAILLCIYGVEVFQFSIVTTSLTHNFSLNPYLVVFTLLAMVMFAGSGGVQRVGSISSAIIPFFVIIYSAMGFWILVNNLTVLPGVLATVVSSAFSGHAAVGGFVGSTIMLATSHGVRRCCYTTDLGIGYASVIHSESSTTLPEKQAALVIFDVFVDTFLICTTSVAIILVTGVWKEPIQAGLLVQTALSSYFPYMHFFMPLFLLSLGYNTINAYFCVGLKCAEYLSPKFGRKAYFVYAFVMLVTFSFIDPSNAQTLMTVAGGLLLMINCVVIFMLRNEISFNLDFESQQETQENKEAQTVVA
jgi:alanine or glycine:cation symporter, AGCS family